MQRRVQPTLAETAWNKVPEITALFWIIKVLGTTIGETGADYLSETLGIGLALTTVIASAVLVGGLVVQFRTRRYTPAVYWPVVVLISVVGTLITDNLTDKLGVPLEVSTIAFGTALAVTFAVWYRYEGTLSIHTIVTARREAFYWLAILFTFSLGTAAGDLVSERFAIGYWQSAMLFGAAIALVALAYYRFGLGEVTAFWIAYILTRPLGASLGDYLTQPASHGGLGFSTTTISLVFLGVIVAAIVYLTLQQREQDLARGPARFADEPLSP
jgi:uncharacterized membrane-anchored protein